jgi:hypothetical protein
MAERLAKTFPLQQQPPEWLQAWDMSE